MRSPSPRPRRLLLAVLAGLLAGGVADAGTLYKWVDANGVTHYSDVPADGAKPVEVDGAQSYHSPPARPATSPGSPRTAAAAAVAYSSLSITAPADGAVLWNEDGQISVAAALDPALAAGHHLWFALDGTRQEAGGLTASLPAPRGEHTLVAIVTDESGTELLSSAPVHFAVRQNSAARPPQGPLLPKKPHG